MLEIGPLLQIVVIVLLFEVAILFFAALRSTWVRLKAKSTPGLAKERPYEGWSGSRITWFADTIGSYRRDRFTRDASGRIHHYVSYNGTPEDPDPSYPGADVTDDDERRGWDLEQMAQNLGCEIQSE